MKMVQVWGVAVGQDRSQPKREVPWVRCVFGGIPEDAHFAVSDREVSLLRQEDVEEAERRAGFHFPMGSLAENLRVAGLPRDIPRGSVLSAGTVEFVVLERGKSPEEPHSYDYRGWCLLPHVGYFLKVVREGVLRRGDPVELASSRPSSGRCDMV